MKRFYTHILPALLSLILLAACADDDTNGSDDEEDERIGGRLMGELTLTGTASAGYPLRWQRVCAQDVVEGEVDPLCSTTRDNGDYRMLGLFNDRGLLAVEFLNRDGNADTLYSIYQLNGPGSASQANVNPTTDALTRVYVDYLRSQPIADCFYEENCAEFMDDALDTSLLERIEENLAAVLGPAWPAGNPSPFSGPYQARPPDDMFNALHRRIRYQHVEDPLSGERELEIWTHALGACTPTDPLISVPYDTLVTTDNLDDDMPSLTADDYDNAVEGCVLPDPPDEGPFSIQITADPNRGDAPLTSNTRVTLVDAPEETTLSTRLINPRGQEISRWTDTERTLTLDNVGTYLVVATATSATDEVTNGAMIDVGLSEVTLETATWGEAGSCSPAAIGDYSQNMCLEKLDGTLSRPMDATDCSALQEVQSLTYSQGICSSASQFDLPLLGVCTNLLQETRLFFYRNTDPAETARQQHDREAERCRNNWSGHWDSTL